MGYNLSEWSYWNWLNAKAERTPKTTKLKSKFEPVEWARILLLADGIKERLGRFRIILIYLESSVADKILESG